jgi:hypothetical protein
MEDIRVLISRENNPTKLFESSEDKEALVESFQRALERGEVTLDSHGYLKILKPLEGLEEQLELNLFHTGFKLTPDFNPDEVLDKTRNDLREAFSLIRNIDMIKYDLKMIENVARSMCLAENLDPDELAEDDSDAFEIVHPKKSSSGYICDVYYPPVQGYNWMRYQRQANLFLAGLDALNLLPTDNTLTDGESKKD